jgi:hypothetical protein
MRGTSRYAKLAALLAASGADVVELAFAEVASVVPDGLPESAYRYRTWWTSNTDASAQSRHGWSGAGYGVSQVDLINRVVTFVQNTCCPAAANQPATNGDRGQAAAHAAAHPTTKTS